MEETINTQGGWKNPQSIGETPSVPLSQKLSGISFTPESLSGGRSMEAQSRFAIAGAVFGALALISFFVIVIGIIFAIIGAALSFAGRHSSRAHVARIGLILSIVGALASIAYMAAVYAGLINYNYFTNELWGIPAGGVQILE